MEPSRNSNENSWRMVMTRWKLVFAISEAANEIAQNAEFQEEEKCQQFSRLA